ncbi:hypothetical protein PF005_g5012 [Phytophthora fragariae]|uniref:Uncharacterized protein n=1 Tax=Phytophthora fragariae TaxID=53985 RepID=A0A6A3FUM2_9STRA|nr:hypothetical protein PF003_g34713 [Phytophthora fragariae]KAE8945388.1 hypothetical protein PF009_g4962 [Phytophthora fragariae]KAE9022583.1 hypothetical protein PF011_g4392 [Phytophthora fragariae]KAE9127466.1 hypothetical protein PF007_g5606 [Phytophthora fragariae]KAE9129634.1 hypothetical protein PF010_g4121 [Phytophthora fragariae]
MQESPSMERQLKLGVKGRLSNQEMEQLRNQLAQAAAYAHIPEHQRAARAAKSQSASQPMTKLYRRVNPPQDSNNCNQARPIRKTLASIQYEQQFTAKAYDSLKPRPTRGIGSAAKIVLQDEYVTKPREVSCIPRNLSTTKSNEGPETDNQIASGKRRGPSAIPQVFIM